MNQLASHHPEQADAEYSANVVSGARAILMVTGGELCGARMNLVRGKTYSVGGDETYDIVLRGAVVDGSSMQITVNADRVIVTHSDRDESSVAAYHDELSFGSSTFAILQSEELSTRSLLAASMPVDADLFDNMDGVACANADAANIATPVDVLSANDTRGKRQHRFMRPLVYSALIMVVGGLSVFAYSVWQGGAFTKSVAAIIPVESLLADAGFEHLHVDRSTNTAVISGYVQSRQDALSLAQLVAAQGESVLNRVKVDAEIRDQIENVLRVNGIVGLVESIGNGAFVANTQLPLGSQLDDLQGLIERDVPSVASFTVNNQVPVVKPVNDPIQLDSGKRVVLVNSEKPSYVVTEDESRYFVGSILPGGYRITNITSGRVLLEKQGKTTELKF